MLSVRVRPVARTLSRCVRLDGEERQQSVILQKSQFLFSAHQSYKLETCSPLFS